MSKEKPNFDQQSKLKSNPAHQQRRDLDPLSLFHKADMEKTSQAIEIRLFNYYLNTRLSWRHFFPAQR